MRELEFFFISIRVSIKAFLGEWKILLIFLEDCCKYDSLREIFRNLLTSFRNYRMGDDDRIDLAF